MDKYTYQNADSKWMIMLNNRHSIVVIMMLCVTLTQIKNYEQYVDVFIVHLFDMYTNSHAPMHEITELMSLGFFLLNFFKYVVALGTRHITFVRFPHTT